MSALPRPDLSPGPAKELNDALHELHHRAGWPSLRALAGVAGVSHTTVSHVFSSPKLPTWGVLELLVEAMDGDGERFHELWLAASAPSANGSSSTPRIAGRKSELAAVRRHLESGTGLLLVTGEAGIGKSRLVSGAAESTDILLVTGHCLLLATEMPFLPFADVLRKVLGHEDERWFKEALAECPPYVAAALAPLLPELADDNVRSSGDDDFARHRMFTASAALLGALAAVRPCALVLEDLHWADGPTLDLLEHLVTGRLAMPIIGTWRTGDPEARPGHEEWSARLRRHPEVSSLELAPLTREETAEQLVLAMGTPAAAALVDRVQALSQGLPLYTEHLAAAPDGEVTHGLGELLDLRLGELEEGPWRVARVLGCAQRSLPVDLLRSATGLSEEDQQRALALLARRRLVQTGVTDLATLAHPLLAEAIRRRLLPGEAGSVHARVAEALSTQPDIEPGEVSHHWREAGRPAEELRWRVAAARRAGQTFAAQEELDNWVRVLELYRLTDELPDLALWQVLTRGMVVAQEIPDLDVATRLAEHALTLDLPDAARVHVLALAGDVICFNGDHITGVALLDDARELLDTLPPSLDLVDVLLIRAGILSMVGRYADVRADLRQALDLVAEFEDPVRARRVLTWAAWHAMAEGDHDRAALLVREGRDLVLVDPDPVSDLGLAVNATDILLFGAAPADTIEAAATPALAHAAEWGLEMHRYAEGLRTNVAEGHLRAGDVDRAATVLLMDVGRAPADGVTVPAVQMRRGEVEAALATCDAAEELVSSRGANWAEDVGHHAEIALWAGRADHAAALIDQALDIMLSNDNARTEAPNLVSSARIRADLLDQQSASPEQRRLVATQLQERRRSAAFDPLGPEAIGMTVPAWALQWYAELGRVQQSDDVAAWAACATAWDTLARPHDAAYCRWRGAQAALRVGQGTVAARLLKKAANGARTHVPLGRAIAATTAGAR